MTIREPAPVRLACDTGFQPVLCALKLRSVGECSLFSHHIVSTG